MKQRYRLITLTMLAGALSCVAQQFSSGPSRTDLIELFTSEGCSSCPPADRKLNALAGDQRLWKDFVPVAFHVDYWNYLGWPDPFSSPDFSNRQRRYTKEWRARTSYTPCFVVNGAAARKPISTGGIDQTGLLKVELKGGKATITFSPVKSGGDYLAWLAPLSGKTNHTVKAGENRGKELEHCFVALGLSSKKMTSTGSRFTATLNILDDVRTKGIAVWVSGTESLTPLQATGGWLKQ